MCQTSSACEWVGSSSTCLTKAKDDDDDADAAVAIDDTDDAVTCTAITAKGLCQTSSACEWVGSSSTCLTKAADGDDGAARSAADDSDDLSKAADDHDDAADDYSYSYAAEGHPNRTSPALAVVRLFEEADVKLSATSEGSFHCAFDFAYCAAASCTRHRGAHTTHRDDVEIATCACQPVTSSELYYAQVGRIELVDGTHVGMCDGRSNARKRVDRFVHDHSYGLVDL